MLATSPGTVIAGGLAEPPQADPQSFLDSLFLKANSAARQVARTCSATTEAARSHA
jgi:hypothetical protein